MALSNKRPQVLIIDDQMESVALLLQYFRGQAVDVMVALDGDDGLRKAQVGQPDVILLDVYMPRLNGYEVCRALKINPRTTCIPVIFLSAAIDLESRLEGFKVGAADYISKPFSSEEVLARVFVHFKIGRQLGRLDGAKLEWDTGVNRDAQLVTEALAFMQDTAQLWQGTEALARKLGSNAKKLNDLFRQQFGLSASEYQLTQRLESTRWKLANSHQQIKLIGRDAGYVNASDFTRAFRMRYGLSPRQYRQASVTQPSPTLQRPESLRSHSTSENHRERDTESLQPDV